MWAEIRDYIIVGFDHILPLGLDHILFILGIFLTARGLKTLALQATLFTLAHSLTLILAALGLIYAPENIVEPLIALSIAALGIEAFLTKEPKTSRWRLALIFGFGLLHGMGFASQFIELGVPTSTLILALVSFNVGVELGQLVILVGAWVLLIKLQTKDWYFNSIQRPLAAVITVTGLYWMVERIIG